MLVDEQPPLLNETMRAIPQRNAFIMDSLLQSVASGGTAAKAQATLKRTDLYGKTGTTNDSLDAWFAGFQPTMTAVAWMGYDTPRKLGDRETGGGLSLPIWINFMETALKGVPVAELPAPDGVVKVGGEWYYDEYAPGRGVASLGVDEPRPSPPARGRPAAAPIGAAPAAGRAQPHPRPVPELARQQLTPAAKSSGCPACARRFARQLARRIRAPVLVSTQCAAVVPIVVAAGRAASQISCSGFCSVDDRSGCRCER